LLSASENLEQLAAQKAEQAAAVARKAQNKVNREQREAQKIIDAADKRRKDADKLAAEADVRELLKAQGFWTSASQFIKGDDMKTLLRAVRATGNSIKDREGFSTSLKLDAAFSFINLAISDDPDHEWPEA